MNVVALFAAGLLAAGTFAAAPADAQRRGWNDRHHGYGGGYDRGRYGDRGWRGNRGWRGYRGWRGGARWNRGYGYRGGYRQRGRVVCRGGYYDQRCFRVHR